ncbi:MAG: hypothetical protein WBN04_19315, partial [Paracoccaceae bacterium]
RTLLTKAIRNNPGIIFGRKLSARLTLDLFYVFVGRPIGPVSALISHSFKDHEEPKTLARRSKKFCLDGRDGLHLSRSPLRALSSSFASSIISR